MVSCKRFIWKKEAIVKAIRIYSKKMEKVKNIRKINIGKCAWIRTAKSWCNVSETKIIQRSRVGSILWHHVVSCIQWRRWCFAVGLRGYYWATDTSINQKLHSAFVETLSRNYLFRKWHENLILAINGGRNILSFLVGRRAVRRRYNLKIRSYYFPPISHMPYE